MDGTQKNIIRFCSLPRSAREILDHIGYSYHPTHITKFIKPLLAMGYIDLVASRSEPTAATARFSLSVENWLRQGSLVP